MLLNLKITLVKVEYSILDPIESCIGNTGISYFLHNSKVQNKIVASSEWLCEGDSEFDKFILSTSLFSYLYLTLIYFLFDKFSFSFIFFLI